MERHQSLAYIRRTVPEYGGQREDYLLCLLRIQWFEIGGAIMAFGEFGVGHL